MLSDDSDDSDTGNASNEKTVDDKDAEEILTSPEVSRRRATAATQRQKGGVSNSNGTNNANGTSRGRGGGGGSGGSGDGGGNGAGLSDGGTSSGSEDVAWFKKPSSNAGAAVRSGAGGAGAGTGEEEEEEMLAVVKVKPAKGMVSPGERRRYIYIYIYLYRYIYRYILRYYESTVSLKNVNAVSSKGTYFAVKIKLNYSS